jgi:hypothetical protein
MKGHPWIPWLAASVVLFFSISNSGLLAGSPDPASKEPARQSQPAPPAGAPAGWWDAVQKEIRTQGGTRVIPRMDETPSWEWSLTLVGYGRGGVVLPVPAAVTTPNENRVEYAHGTLTEWYVNDARGLEQGFLLPGPPEGLGGLGVTKEPTVDRTIPGQGRDVRPQDLVHLDLALEGDLSARVLEGGAAVEFVTPAEARAVRYAELKVTDAAGQPLPAWMEGWNASGRRGMRLVIDARGAAWPVTVDPLATSPTWSVEYGQVGDALGWSVSTAGDVNGDGFADVIVGAIGYTNGQASEGNGA